ncbi:MAG: ABC transporter ATP-binding protein [Candidatus Obscuribacterales bacterium]|nr:ABC transporter ATP-binding protein [Candidatus Obscuribacterales bacterium]
MSPMENSGILLKDLSVGWRKDAAVCYVQELELKAKQITVLCGPNGAGKSTLLKTIASQLKKLSGEIFLDGKNPDEMKASDLAKKLAFVPQFIDTRKSLTVEEWVALGRNPHQAWHSWSNSSADRKKIEESLERSNSVSLKHQFVETLSGGERQRVMIATALAQEPAYLLLDEPTAHLDFRHQLELLLLLKQLRNEGLGILLVLHDLNLSARIADQIVLLKKEADGRSVIAASGDVETVLSREILKEVYGVEMAILESESGHKIFALENISGNAK